jgi:hypothetical protein
LTATAPTCVRISRALASADVPRRIRELEIRPCPYRSSFPIHELEVTFTDGSTASLVAKQVDRAPLTPSGRPVKPDLLHDAPREVRVYETLLAPADVGTAAFHGAADGLLLLEKVDATPLWQVDDLEVWCAVARWLAGFHRRFGTLEDEQARAATLIRYDRRFLSVWLERARSFVPYGALDRIVRAHETAVERLASMPQTLVHGELYPSNVLVAAGSTGIRVCPIDWETAGIGPGVVDLAALATGWSSAAADLLAEAYREEAADADGQAFAQALRCSRLHLAVRWLGWSQAWSPPPEHRHDWLAEALRLAGEIDG